MTNDFEENHKWLMDEYMMLYKKALASNNLEVAIKALDSISGEISNLEWQEEKKNNPKAAI